LLGLHGGGGCSTGRLLHLLVFRPRLRHLAAQSVTTRRSGSRMQLRSTGVLASLDMIGLVGELELELRRGSRDLQISCVWKQIGMGPV